MLINKIIPSPFPNIDEEEKVKSFNREVYKTNNNFVKENSLEFNKSKIKSEKYLSLRLINKARRSNESEIKDKKIDAYIESIRSLESLDEIKNIREKAL